MAATPDLGYARKTPSTRLAARGTPIALRAAWLAIALACAAAGLAIAGAYPIAPLVALVAFAAWTAFAALRFSLALPALIALVPVVGFATWTGWLAFEETDLLVLASLAGGYAALAVGRGAEVDRSRRPAAALSIVSIALVGLFLASGAIALVRGVDAAGGLRFDPFDWSAGYDSAQNSLRLFKSILFASLMAPLLVRELREPGGFDRFGAGLTAALGLAALVVVGERLAFTGLLDFSDDYRVTGPFWEMHVGGAALDGFLALTIPFAIREAFRHKQHVRFAAAAAVVALAAYASLVTFSRGVYGAVPLSAIVLVLLIGRQRLRVERADVWIVLVKAVVFAAVVAVCGFIVFRTGGYRSVLASFLVLACAIAVDDALRRLDLAAGLSAAVGALFLSAAGVLIAGVLPKGPYLVFAAATVATIAAIVHAERVRTRSAAIFVVAGWLWLAVGAVEVARHWGGSPAFHDSAVMLAGFAVLVFAASRLPRSVWPERRRERLITVGVAALVLGTVAVFAAGAYMGGRFSSTNEDLAYRVEHWKSGMDRMHGSDWLFGKGLGRFPASSMYEGPDATSLGVDRFIRRGGETFVELIEPRARYLGFNEMFRMSQRVAVQPHGTYVATIEARSASPSVLHIEACEKHLIYNGTCRSGEIAMPEPSSAWRRFTFQFYSDTMGDSPWWARRPVFFALAADGGAIEIHSAHLIGPGGVDLLANGDFHDHLARWFSSSDRFHLPWHMKNLELGLLFDQGAFGLGLFALVVGGALLRTSIGRAHRHPDAPFVAAAIVGYLVVGATDTLLDVPRGAFLFYLVVLTGLMLRNPRVDAPVASTPTPAPTTPPATSPIDERAERARRRQRAFGERHHA